MQALTGDYVKSIRSNPTGKIKQDGTILDKLYSALETSEKPLDRVIQLIAEYHGPWNGSSRNLTDFVAAMAECQKSSVLDDIAKELGKYTKKLEQAIKDLPPSSVNKMDKYTCAVMPTPLYRNFINRSQKIHPAINMYIQSNIKNFPYFKQVSEDVGQFATIVMNITETDPLKWSKGGGIQCLDTNNRLNKNLTLKLFAEIAGLMENANDTTNTLFLRAMPIDNNMSLIHKDYSTGKPKAHGHNFTMDVFNGDRKKSTVYLCYAAVVMLMADAMRLINKFFCVKSMANYKVEGFRVTVNEGPNGEPVTYIVDQSGRPMTDGEETNDINDPTNDKVIGTKKEHKKEIP